MLLTCFSCSQRLGVSEDEDMGEESTGAQEEDIDLNFDTVHNVIAQETLCPPLLPNTHEACSTNLFSSCHGDY